MGFGRLQDPAAMGRLVSSEGVGPLSLEKRAGGVENGINQILKMLYHHPRTSGAVIGGAIGGTVNAFFGEKSEDKKENVRNTIGSLLGGAVGGAMVGDVVEKLRGDPRLPKFVVRSIAGAAAGPAAGRLALSAFVPEPAPPAALVDILGKKKQYSDVDLVKKYNEEKPRGEREQKFVGALRSLYSSAEKFDEPQARTRALKDQAKVLVGALGGVAMPVFMGESVSNAVIQALPSIIAATGGATKAVRKELSPAVTVSDQRDAKTRASFNDAQLRRLLRGLRVEQVQEHVIK